MEDTSNKLKIYASPLPFSNKQVRAYAPPGATIQSIVDQVCPARLSMAGVGAMVTINGHRIHRKHWHAVRPKLGTVINVRIVPQGGKGKKSPLVSLLSIAIMVAAPYVGAALGSVAGFGGLWVGSTFFSSATIYGAAFGVLGKMALSALAPPPKQSNANGGQVSNPTESPTLFIEGARNSINPYGVIPICLGTNRMVPPQGARPYTESQNNDQYVRQLFTYGYGPALAVTDFRIGETSIDEFTDFEMEHRLAGDLDQPTNLFPNDPFQDEYNILLSQPDGFSTRTTRPNTDEAIVDVTFPRGLCAYDPKTGKRGNYNVRLEVQFSPAGEDDWSAGAIDYKVVPGAAFTVATPPFYTTERVSEINYDIGYRIDLVVVDEFSGAISIVKGTAASNENYGGSSAGSLNGAGNTPKVPSGKIRVATLTVKSRKRRGSGSYPTVTTITTTTDDRQSSLFSTTFQTTADFKVTTAGDAVTVAGGGIKQDQLNIKGAQSETLRKSVRLKFPTTGTYDIRMRRLSNDTDSDQIFDDVYLTAIKSVNYQPPVNMEGQNGTAVRIRATDQLNGGLDTFNALVSCIIPDYVAESGEWIPRITSNPASLYRYVLQYMANARALPDSKINIEDLEDWHTHCEEQGYTYNRVIDYSTSLDEVLRDIAAAGAASPAIVDGKRTIVIDRIKNDIVQIITPRNSWGYTGEMLYSNLPHGFRVQFRNAEAGYLQDERIVYDDGYDEYNASEFEGLELVSCTNSALAFKTARRHIAQARLRPEKHIFSMDFENLVALRGDRIKLVHDVPIVGVGDFRIKTVITETLPPDDDHDEDWLAITGFTMDDTVTIPTVGTYYVRVRLPDGTQVYREAITEVGDTKQLMFLVPVDAPPEDDIDIAKGDLGYVVEAGGELDLVITRIEPGKDLTAKITAQNYAPEVLTAESAPIPPFQSVITTPLEFLRPSAPVLLSAQSDERVMIQNPDGSFAARAVFTLENNNEGDVYTQVKIKVSGTDKFSSANTFELSPERVGIAAVDMNQTYDIHIRYGRAGSSILSAPLQLNGYKITGSGGKPATPTNFKLTVSGEQSLWSWDKNTEIDIYGYRMYYSALFEDATVGTSQLLEDIILENRYVAPFQAGTYFLKAVDLSGIESEVAAAVVTYDPGSLQNAVALATESPTFAGTKDNVAYNAADDTITLADISIPLGYYYFDNAIDLGGVFTSFVSTRIIAGGVFLNNVYVIDDIFDETNIFAGGTNNIYSEPDIFAMADVFGIGLDSWKLTVEYRISLDGVTYGDWNPLIAGNLEFWSIEFRLKMESLAPEQSISPSVSLLEAKVDMPDRIERGEDIAVDATTGCTVVFSPAFRDTPSIVFAIQDFANGDEIRYIAKTASGFTVKVYNTLVAAYVDRSIDYIASGYGRDNT